MIYIILLAEHFDTASARIRNCGVRVMTANKQLKEDFVAVVVEDLVGSVVG